MEPGEWMKSASHNMLWGRHCIWINLQEDKKSAVTYCCNSAPDEAVGFEVSKYI